MSRGSCPWEAPSIVFYVSRRVLGAPDSAWLWDRVGPFKETKDRRPEDRRPETGGLWTGGLGTGGPGTGVAEHSRECSIPELFHEMFQAWSIPGNDPGLEHSME